MDFLKFGKDTTTLTNFSDPFKKDKIKHVSINIYPNEWCYNHVYTVRISIEFKNGNTSGEQDITKSGDTAFEDAIKEMRLFIESL